MLIGTWKNIRDLEDSLTLEELELVIKAAREKEHRLMKFYAAFKGVDMDDDEKEDAKERFEAAQRRAEARLAGLSEEEAAAQSELADFSSFGLEVETE